MNIDGLCLTSSDSKSLSNTSAGSLFADAVTIGTKGRMQQKGLFDPLSKYSSELLHTTA